MKVLVDMHFQTVNYRGQTNNSTQAFTYMLWKKTAFSSPFEATADVSSGLLSNVDDAIHFGEVILGPWTTMVNFASGVWKSVRCDDATIQSTLESPNNGDHYSIDARNGIRVVPGGHLKPNGRLRIIPDPLAQFGQPASNNFLTQFCSDQVAESYQGNQATANAKLKVAAYEQELERRSKDSAKPLSMVQVHPNPATARVTIVSSDDEIEALELYDLSGRLIEGLAITKKDQYVYEFDASKLSNGVYLVKTLLGDYSQTNRLVIAH